MPLSTAAKIKRKKEIFDFVVDKFNSEKNLNIAKAESFRGKINGADAEAYAISITFRLNNKYRGKSWFTLDAEDSIEEIWQTQKLDGELRLPNDAGALGFAGGNASIAPPSHDVLDGGAEMANEAQPTEGQPATDEPKETFESFLIANGIDVFGKWVDSADPSEVTTTLEIAYRHPSNKVVAVKWTVLPENGAAETTLGLLGGDAGITPVVQGGKKTHIATRTVADGYCFVENGEGDNYKMVAEFEFDEANKKVIRRELKISPKTAAKALAKHRYVVFTFGATTDLDRAQIWDQDKNKCGNPMSRVLGTIDDAA